MQDRLDFFLKDPGGFGNAGFQHFFSQVAVEDDQDPGGISTPFKVNPTLQLAQDKSGVIERFTPCFDVVRTKSARCSA